MIDAKATLSGLYQAAKVTLADGRIIDTLVRVVETPKGPQAIPITGEDAAFEERFANTDTTPSPAADRVTSALERTSPASTRERHMMADLVKYLGTPERALTDGKLSDECLDWLNKHPSSATMLRRVCYHVGGDWMKVRDMIPKFIADPPDYKKTP